MEAEDMAPAAAPLSPVSLQVPNIVSHIYHTGLLMDAQVQHSLHFLLLLMADKNPGQVVTMLLQITPQGERYCGETLWLPNLRNTAGPHRGAGPSIPPLFPALVRVIQACNSQSWLGQPEPAQSQHAAPQPSPACLGRIPRHPTSCRSGPGPTDSGLPHTNALSL